MESDGQAASAVSQPHRHPTPRTALILYGSETGNAQDVAEEIARLLERLRFDATVIDLNSVPLRDLVRSTLVVLAISTTGQGEFPQNARSFWKALLSSALKPGILRKVRFTSFGLGDSSYAQYNVVHRMVHGRLVQLGAQAFCERGEGNEQHPEGHSAGLREWVVSLQRTVLDVFPLPDDLEAIPEDVFVEPKWKLRMCSAGHPVPKEDTDKGSTGPLPELPSHDLMPIAESHTARIQTNSRITAASHFQDVRLLDMQVEQTVPYFPGAVAVVYPKNFPEDVTQFIELMDWVGVADAPLDLVSNSVRGGNSSPSPLRHLNLNGITITIRWLLENIIDIMSIPRRSFFASLVHFAGTRIDDEAYQKERLLELANPELIDELWDYTTRPKRTILEVMMDFTTIRIPWQYALSVLPLMRGRQFSIASGGDLRADEAGQTRIQLLIAIVDPPSPIIKWRRRYGVCTRYIASLQEGQQISLGIQQGYLDVKPAELEVPVILIGPGTGLAPMRSMVHQRLAWNRELHLHPRGKSLEGDILFFGCRSSDADYFFRDEWEHLATADGLKVFTAFSRDKTQPRQYVQDQIRENGALVCSALLRDHGKVYVSGSSGNMPKGVRQALLDVFVEHAGMPLADAEASLEEMEKSGRYKQETW